MADQQVTVNNALCFLFSRLHRSDYNVTMGAIESFYSPEEITTARMVLLEDAVALNLQHLPRSLPSRRAGDGRKHREIEDIYTILSIVDEAKSLHKMPRYVSDDPLKMPSLLLTEGDLRVIMGRINQLEAKLDKFMDLNVAMLSGVHHPTGKQGQHDQHDKRTTNRPLNRANAATGSSGPSTHPFARGIGGPTGPEPTAAAAFTAVSAALKGVQQSSSIPPTSQSLGARPKTSNSNKSVNIDEAAAMNWASEVAAQLSTDDHYDSEPYQQVLTRSEKKKLRASKRRRMRSSENALGELYTTDDTDADDSHIAAAAMNWAAAVSNNKPKAWRNGARLLIGEKDSTSLSTSTGINNLFISSRWSARHCS